MRLSVALLNLRDTVGWRGSSHTDVFPSVLALPWRPLGGVMVIRHCGRLGKWRTAAVAGVLSAAPILTTLDEGNSEGLFDFLFGGQQQQSPQVDNHPPPPGPGVGRIAPPALSEENVKEGSGSTGHAVAFCVRLCDGRHYPLEQVIYGTPAETCRAMCPYSRTKIFIGAEIDRAVAPDGERYSSLETAFLYRKQLVNNCTCNGKDAFGLTIMDVQNDPTLRSGDIVSTKDGLVTYVGKSGQGPNFTPANPATIPADIGPAH